MIVKQEFRFLSYTWTIWYNYIKKDLVESFNSKIKLKTFFRNNSQQKQETKLANKEPSIKSKTQKELLYCWMEAVNKDIVKIFSDKNKLLKSNVADTDKMLWNIFQNATILL